MRKTGKQVLSLLLAVVLALGMLPGAAWAAETGSLTITNEFSSEVVQAAAANETFPITISGPTDLNGTFDGVEFVDGEATVDFIGQDSITISVPAGTYSVDAAIVEISGYTSPSPAYENNPATVEVGGNATITVTQRYKKTIPVGEKIYYNLLFDANGGTGGPETMTQIADDVFTVPSDIPTWEGYNFAGWADGNSNIYNAGSTFTIPSGTAYTLTATWTPIPTDGATDGNTDETTGDETGETTDGETTDGTTGGTTDGNTGGTTGGNTTVGADTGNGTIIGNITVDDMEGDNTGSGTELPALPDLGESPIQGEAVKDDPAVTWFERLRVPKDSATLYEKMSGVTVDGQGEITRKTSIFEAEEHFILPSRSTGSSSRYQIKEISCVDFSVLDTYAGENGGLNSTIFNDASFFTIPANAEDQKVDFGKLQPGDMVRTANFNGVYVTSRPMDEKFNDAKAEACEYIAAVFHAFDRDCPEVFWLNGDCRIRVMVAADQTTKVQTAYFFLVTVDKEGFTMLSPAWLAEGSIEAGIQRRDAAVEKILANVTAGDRVGKIKQLNQWLTENNQYNTTADLSTIGNEPHKCLAALEGRIDKDGPVCDGYSRAMKVLCDKLEIPCVLVTGWARTSKTSQPGFHMWNIIQVDGAWYAADITWDDPSVKNFVGAKSGRENENFLLVGADTVIYEMAFNVSHVVQNQVAAGGVDFNNGPTISASAFGEPLSGQEIIFSDVPSDSWYYDAVQWAVEKGVTNGTGVNPATFSPMRECKQVEILTFLWRAAGEPSGSAALPFTPKNSYAEGTLRWAYEKGMIGADFDEDAPCTRATAVKFIWQAKDSPAASGSTFSDVPAGADYAQAVAWAVENEVTNGTGTNPPTFSPDDTCTRGQIVTFLYRAWGN